MNAHHILFCLVFFSLQVRSSSTVEALSHYGVVGENISMQCGFLSSGTLKMFCRETCEGQNLLIRTTNDEAQIGRYRTEYVREASKTFSVLSVSISELTWSDSGRYRCGLGDSSSSASYRDFSLLVVDALLDGSKDPHLCQEAGGSLTVACFFKDSGRKRLFCRGECGEDEVLVQTKRVRAESGRYIIDYDKGHKSEGVLLVTIKNLTQSDSGRYRCKMDGTFPSNLHRDFNITVIQAAEPATTTESFSSSSEGFTSSGPSETTKLSHETLTATGSKSNPNFVLVVPTLTFIIILLCVALLLFRRETSDKAQAAFSVEPQETPASEDASIYENDSEEDGQWRAVDVAIYSAYGESPNSRPAGAQGEEDGSSEAEEDSRL